jgi:zinc protease
MHRSKLLALPLIAILALSFAAYAQTLPAGVTKVTAVEGITEYAYPNGLHVLLFPDPSKPKLTVNMTYLVGSRLEGYGESGMAHLLEHILFLKTSTGRDVKKELADHGADFNGSTWFDRTNYFETVTASDENLRWALSLEADRMVKMRVEKELLDPEMTVVRNEFEMGENDPGNILYQRVLETAYTAHSYGRMTIGNRSDIENVSIERLAAFYKKYYQPEDAILTIAGQFDESKALAWVAETVGTIPRPARKLEPTYTVEPTQDGEREVILRRVGDNQMVAVAYHVPAAAHPDTAPLEVLATILGDNPSGRLYKALVYNKKATEVEVFEEEMHDPGFVMAMVQLRQEQSLDEARDILLKTVESFTAEPPSSEEVERAKTRILKQIELSLTNSQRIGVELSETAACGDWRLLFAGRDEIKKVTPNDVARVAKAYFKSSNRTLGEFIPTKAPDRAVIPATPDIAALLKDFKGGEAISQGEAFVPSPANIESRIVRQTLPNGMKLALLPRKTRGGVVSVSLGMRFGDEKALFGQATVAALAGGTLMRGTKTKTRQQIQDESDRLKARIAVNGTPTGATASIETIEANLPGALRLVAEVLRQPAFPEAEFEQLRQQRIASVEESKSEPQSLASIELARHMRPYPRGDVRHAGTPDEQIEDLKKATLEEVRAFYNKFYGASNAELVISGQFDPALIQKLAAEIFGDWKSPSPFQRVLTPYRPIEAVDTKIETPDKENSTFLSSAPIRLTDDDADYPALVIANYMFGDSESSHLFSVIRTKEGLSYGVGSQLSAPTKDDGGSLSVWAISAPQNTPKVEASFRDELARALKEGFTAEELAAAKKGWLAERMVARSQDRELLATLLSRERYGRTMQWDADLEAKVSALTADQVSAAFRRHIDPGAFTVVKAGDFKKAGVWQ